MDLGGEATAYIPAGYRPAQAGVIDLVVHLHGAPTAVEPALAKFPGPAVLVEVNRNGLSRVYAEPFRDPKLLTRLIDGVVRAAADGDPAARAGRVVVSSFSAGFGGVREMLKDPGHFARIDALYRPYHRALRALLSDAVERFGIASVVDCHSMPSAGAASGLVHDMRADIVLGDRNGTSCDPDFVETLDRALRGAGYSVKRNKPYAGGYTTALHADPPGGIHVVQIEVDRALYMDPGRLQRHDGFPSVRAALGRLAHALIAAAPTLGLGPYAQAAE